MKVKKLKVYRLSGLNRYCPPTLVHLKHFKLDFGVSLAERLRQCRAMYRIIGIIYGHYIVQTPKGFKKPEVLNLVMK